MSRSEAKQQFENEIKADLNRWFEESDLDVEELASSAVKAIEDWPFAEFFSFEIIGCGEADRPPDPTSSSSSQSLADS